MVELQEVWCENIVVFDKARLKLNKHPLTVVRGLNLDRKSKKSANAVGKSLLLSLIPTIRYFAPPTSTKKKSAKEIHRKGSLAGFRVKAQGHIYEILQRSVGKSVNLEIKEDGVEMKFRAKGGGKKGSKTHGGAIGFLEKLMPMSSNAFYSLAYIDVRQNNKLQRGTDAGHV
jgi:hypothetical protein